MKRDYSITRQQQDDLIEAYKKVAQSSWTQLEAYEKAVKLPAKRYYITPRQALQVLSPMFKGDFELVNMMLENRRRMYYSLYNKVIEMSERRQFLGKSLWYIVQFAVLEPAPEFFMSAKNLDKIRLRMKRGRIDDEGRIILTKNEMLIKKKREQTYKKMMEHRKRMKEKYGEDNQ